MEAKQSPQTINSEFLTTYSPNSLKVQFKEIKGVKDVLCISQKITNLYGLRQIYGEEKVEALLKLQLLDLNEVLGLKQPFSERQIDEISEEIISLYSYLNMADLHLIFKRIKTGYYGELYDRLSTASIFSFFEKYFTERCQEAAKQSLAE
ncbi:MAG: hypothetical protein RR328_04535, partial [Bacteroidales bacterium]